MSEEKLDRIIAEMEKTTTAVTKHGEVLARLDERSKNQKDRLNRIEKKTTIVSAITGTLSGGLVVLAKMFGFDGS